MKVLLRNKNEKAGEKIECSKKVTASQGFQGPEGKEVTLAFSHSFGKETDPRSRSSPRQLININQAVCMVASSLFSSSTSLRSFMLDHQMCSLAGREEIGRSFSFSFFYLAVENVELTDWAGGVQIPYIAICH